MKYFLDTEFIEGLHNPLFGKKRHFIDLISIALVGEDGSEFYAISSEYNYKDADQWVKDNVILPLYLKTVHGDARMHCDVGNFHKQYGMPNNLIMQQILLFIYRDSYSDWMDGTGEFLDRAIRFGWYTNKPIEFYGYYADYDWVLFCSLFGRMVSLPANFPMYCKDLKQMLDEKALSIYPGTTYYNKANTPDTLENRINWIKARPEYPKQENGHCALDDAKWNKRLYDFLQTI